VAGDMGPVEAITCVLAHASESRHVEPGAIEFVLDEACCSVDGPRIKWRLDAFRAADEAQVRAANRILTQKLMGFFGCPIKRRSQIYYHVPYGFSLKTLLLLRADEFVYIVWCDVSNQLRFAEIRQDVLFIAISEAVQAPHAPPFLGRVNQIGGNNRCERCRR